MTIEQIDTNRLLIILEDEEMRSYSLDFDKMRLDDPDSRSIIKDILLFAGMAKGMEINGKNLFVEAMTHNSGCLFIVTILSDFIKPPQRRYRIKKSVGTLIYGFDDTESFLSVIEKLYSYGYIFENSKAYYCPCRYYLVIYHNGGIPMKALSVMEEFGTRELSGKVNLAQIEEKSKLISGCHAILTIGAYLSD